MREHLALELAGAVGGRGGVELLGAMPRELERGGAHVVEAGHRRQAEAIDEIRRVLGSRAVVDEELRTRLGEIREAGYAVTSSELQAGVTGIARAVRLPDRVGGSVAILLPSERADDLTEVSRQLATAVDRVVRELTANGA